MKGDESLYKFGHEGQTNDSQKGIQKFLKETCFSLFIFQRLHINIFPINTTSDSSLLIS